MKKIIFLLTAFFCLNLSAAQNYDFDQYVSDKISFYEDKIIGMCMQDEVNEVELLFYTGYLSAYYEMKYFICQQSRAPDQ